MPSALTFPPELITRLRNQEQAAFNALVQKSHFRLLGFAGSIAGKELAEDIMQDAWIAIWRGLPGFEGRASLTTWLYTIVRNECAARLKKEGRMVLLQESADRSGQLEDWMQERFHEDGHWNESQPHWTMNTPEAMLEEQELQDCIDKNIIKLQKSQQSVFRLRELEQLPLDEVCNILDLSHSNVRVLLHRARLRLLQVIDHYQVSGEC
ncbi:MAG: sigma-70 family RNA polymerase sigma factor [Pseudohongiellaceae bacterium]